jgi:hypothetical protein
MQTHRIIAQPWQLKAAAEGTLGAIILPLVPQPKADGSLFFRNKKTDFGRLIPATNPVSQMQLSEYCEFVSLPYDEGDHIYLAEKWTQQSSTFGEFERYVLKSKEPNWCDDRRLKPEWIEPSWEPPHTMPEEAAQYWFDIEEVQIVQRIELPLKKVKESSLFNPPTEEMIELSIKARFNPTVIALQTGLPLESVQTP